jgi:phytoene/squalene synthetase
VVTLYAWCRHVDDDIDEEDDKARQFKNWKRQSERLDAIYNKYTTDTKLTEVDK